MLGQPEAESFNVQDLLQWGIMGQLEAVSNIGAVATKEASMLKVRPRGCSVLRCGSCCGIAGVGCSSVHVGLRCCAGLRAVT